MIVRVEFYDTEPEVIADVREVKWINGVFVLVGPVGALPRHIETVDIQRIEVSA
jgi:hypothetical protein